MRAVRPLEWVVGLFAGFVLVRAGPSAFLAWPALLTDRAGAVVVALLVVALLQHLVLLHRSRRRWPGWGLVTVAPFFLLVGLSASDHQLTSALADATTAADALLVLARRAVVVLAWSVPWPLCAAWWLQRPPEGRWPMVLLRSLGAAARDFAPLVLLLSGYSWMETVIGTPAHDLDTLFAGADRALFLGADAFSVLERVVHPWLSELLALVYASYALLIPGCLGVLSVERGRAFRESALALGLVLALGYVGYALWPVKGPLASRSFSVPLELYLVREVKEALMDRLRITYDCFPSMHTAATLVLVGQCARHARRLARWLWPLAVAMPVACVYLRYHYVVDVLAGAGLACLVLAVAPWLQDLHERAVARHNGLQGQTHA